MIRKVISTCKLNKHSKRHDKTQTSGYHCLSCFWNTSIPWHRHEQQHQEKVRTPCPKFLHYATVTSKHWWNHHLDEWTPQIFFFLNRSQLDLASQLDSSRGKKKLKFYFFTLLLYIEIKIHPSSKNQLYHLKFPHFQYTSIKGFKLLFTTFSGWLMSTLRLLIFTSENTPAHAQLSSD